MNGGPRAHDEVAPEVVASARGLTKRYAPDVTALAEVSFTVGPGEFVAVLVKLLV